MNKIRPWLYIGKYRETRNTHLLGAYSIQAMLQLADPVSQSGIASLYLPVIDGVPLSEELLRQGVDFVMAEKDKEHTILIACGAGISRSSAFAVAALKESEGLGLLEAMRTVRQGHSQAMPHAALWESLCGTYGEEISFLEMVTQSLK